MNVNEIRKRKMTEREVRERVTREVGERVTTSIVWDNREIVKRKQISVGPQTWEEMEWRKHFFFIFHFYYKHLYKNIMFESLSTYINI